MESQKTCVAVKKHDVRVYEGKNKIMLMYEKHQMLDSGQVSDSQLMHVYENDNDRREESV